MLSLARRRVGMLLPLILLSCSDGGPNPREARAEYRFIPEAAAACGLPGESVVNWLHRAPRNNLMVLEQYDNSTQELADAKTCLQRWALANGYLFVEQESRMED